MNWNLFKSKPKDPAEMSALELFENRYLDACNSSSIIDDLKAGKDKIWYNPNNQECFNSAWCSPQDFIDLYNGKGALIKGESEEDKAKFWKYAQARNEIDYSVLYLWEYLPLLHEKRLKPKHHVGGFGEPHDIIDQTQNSDTVIKQMLGTFVLGLVYDIEGASRNYSGVINDENPLNFDQKSIDRIKKEWRNNWYGCAATLVLLGHGTFGACNTPQQISNLSWAQDLVYAKAMYIFLKKHNYDFPDVEFVHKNRYKM